MNKGTWVALIAALMLLTAGAGWYWYKARPPRALAPEPVAEGEPDTIPPSPPPVARYPVPEPTPVAGDVPAAPMPGLDDSDGPVRARLAGAFGEAPVEAFLVPDRIVRHVVATIDSLDAQPVRLKTRPLTAVAGRPVVDSADGRLWLSPRNAERYDPYVSALQAADAQGIVDVYLRYYPLFQRAYAELGYPQRHFNDRVVAIIDHLLETPVPTAPIELTRPKVLFQFADEALESRSWGQKLLIRMGPDHAETVKRKLREIRAALVAVQP